MHLLSLARNLAVAVLITVGFAASPASAQNSGDIAGQWYCKYSMEPFSGNAMDKHYWEFQINLVPNGSYQMQGFYYNPVVGQIPVQGGGQWGITQEGNIKVEGRLLRQDAGWGPFQFLAKPANARSLYLQFRGNTHMTNLTCQR
jgi:hypothetical protein